MTLVIRQPGTPERFCLFDEYAEKFIATGQDASNIVAQLVPILVAGSPITHHGALSKAGKLIRQARKYAADGPARDPLWQVAKDSADPGTRAWVAETEGAATYAGQPATPAAPRPGVKVTLGWVVARDYPKGDATVREYLGLYLADNLLDLCGQWGEREEAVRLPQHQARALVRGLRRQGEDTRVVRLWRWVATG